MEPLTAPAGATIVVCYHAHADRRTVERTYQHCDYCLTMREGSAGYWRPRVRYHTATALYDQQRRLLCSSWRP